MFVFNDFTKCKIKNCLNRCESFASTMGIDYIKKNKRREDQMSRIE